jgi:hypothetical protein
MAIVTNDARVVLCVVGRGSHGPFLVSFVDELGTEDNVTSIYNTSQFSSL